MSAESKTAQAPAVKDVTKKDGLNLRQRAFVDLFLTLGNASEAYRQAGYAVTKSSGANAGLLLKSSKIQAALETELRKHKVSAPAVLREMAMVVYDGDLKQFEPYLQGRVSLDQLSESGVNTRLIKKLTIRDTPDGKAISIELRDADAMLDRLAKILRLYDGQSERTDLGPAQVINVQINTQPVAKMIEADGALSPGLSGPDLYLDVESDSASSAPDVKEGT